MHYHQEPPPTANKPPRPPPLSVSLPSYTDSDTPTRSNSDESPHSPLRSESPLRSDDPQSPTPISTPPSFKNGSIEKYYSPLTSPLPTTPPKGSDAPDNFPPRLSHHHHVINLNRREDPPPQTSVVYGGGGEGERKGRVGFERAPPGVFDKVGLVLRVLEFVFCLVSFSVMASDKTQGWSGDSFDRYKEYRYCLAVAIIGFVYSAFQTFDLSCYLATGKHAIAHLLRYEFDFILDQILAYLLISASSASASRVDEWQVNWGKDEFTEKASASISMAFFAFIAFALSSLNSGYNLCTRDFS